ncbi:hypothetical protein O181_013766 [Austropuccinia psidii MF-1]|uniref:Uncharacterized protein n=1 Tax=Austropuccinia psidii MF-1 TaxID=1389203 RepID=A0A9Q3C0F7_9BASI|nr:hypothetical protein [Austropuccinia psidii MF-1]
MVLKIYTKERLQTSLKFTIKTLNNNDNIFGPNPNSIINPSNNIGFRTPTPAILNQNQSQQAIHPSNSLTQKCLSQPAISPILPLLNGLPNLTPTKIPHILNQHQLPQPSSSIILIHSLHLSPSSIAHSSSLNINNQPLNQQVITSQSSLNNHSNPLNPHSTCNHRAHSNLTSNKSYLIPRQSPFQTQQFISGLQTINQLKAWAQLASIIELVPSNTSIARRTGSINLNYGSNWYSLEQLQQLQQVFSHYHQHFEMANSARRCQHQAIQQQHLLQQSHHHLKPPQQQQQQLQTISSFHSPNSLKHL